MSNKKLWLKQGLNQSVILKKSLIKEPEQEGSAWNAKPWLLGTEETYGVGIIMEIFVGNGWHFLGKWKLYQVIVFWDWISSS